MSDRGFILQLALWLWFTVLFANFAEAVAEGRGKAQADSLRKARKDTIARRLRTVARRKFPRRSCKRATSSSATGDIIPADGEVIEGIASVDEAAITGESAPVIRESGGDRSAVTGGTRVISDRIVIRITAEKGHGFLDRMIAMVEGAKRQKTPNEIALTILLSALTLIFLLVCVTLKPFGIYSGVVFSVPVLVALLVCLIPTTIGGLLSAIGISGIDRLIRRNVMATSGRAVEAAGDIDVLLLDKTGTITLGNRMATDFFPRPASKPNASPMPRNSPRSPTKRPKAAASSCSPRRNSTCAAAKSLHPHAQFVPFTAQTRMSGVDFPAGTARPAQSHSARRRGRRHHVSSRGRIRIAGRRLHPHPRTVAVIRKPSWKPKFPAPAARRWSSPTAAKCSASIQLKDVVKGGIKERFAQLRKMGIRTVMITGDNPLTAAAIAAEAGVDDFMAAGHARGQAQAHPRRTGRRPPRRHDRRRHERRARARPGRRRRGHEHRHAGRARSRQHGGSRQQPDQAHRDRRDRQATAHDPRLAHDVQHRQRRRQIFRHHSRDARWRRSPPSRRSTSCGSHRPQSAILSAVIFNALIIIALIPLALRGVAYRPIGALAMLQRNLLIYGLGGVIVPFIGIKAIDVVITALHLV